MQKEVKNNNVKQMLVKIIFEFSKLDKAILEKEQNHTEGLIQEQRISEQEIAKFLERMISYSPIDLSQDINTSRTLNIKSSSKDIALKSFGVSFMAGFLISGGFVSMGLSSLDSQENDLLRMGVGVIGLCAVVLAGLMLELGCDVPWTMDLMWVGLAVFGTALVNVKLSDNEPSVVGCLSGLGPAVVGVVSLLTFGTVGAVGIRCYQTLKELSTNRNELKKLFEAVDGIIKCDSTNDFKLIFTQGCRLLDQTPIVDTDEKWRKIFISGILNTLEQKVDNNESLDDNQKQKYKEVIALGKDNIDQIGSKTEGFKLCEELKRIDRDAIGSQPGI